MKGEEWYDELVARLVRDLGVDIPKAVALVDAAEPLWDVMSRLGWVDSFGGMESRRVLPLTLSAAYAAADQGPFDPNCN